MTIKLRKLPKKMICEFCKKEITGKNFIKTSSVPYEGCSDIHMMERTEDNREQYVKSYSVCDFVYCDLKCLFKEIKRELKIKE